MKRFKRVYEPKQYDVVMHYFEKEGLMEPVIIINGNYLIEGRLSNFWKVLSLVDYKIHDVYGWFYKEEAQ